MENVKYIIVPDVHGRLFYKDVLDTFMENGEANMIFLGDYVDPYPHEGISPKEALVRFEYIIDKKAQYPDRITLLMGNHDLHYIDGSRRGCRMDYDNYDTIKNLLTANADLFEYVKCVSIGFKNFIFSHAGFCFPWFKHYAYDLGVDVLDDDKNDTVLKSVFRYEIINETDWNGMSKNDNWMKAYGDVGSSRGGWSNHPGFLWADLTDHLFDDIRVANCEQIFGHTMQNVGQPVRFDNCYCIDCQQVFFIDDNGIVKNKDFKDIEINGGKIKNAYLKYFDLLEK